MREKGRALVKKRQHSIDLFSRLTNEKPKRDLIFTLINVLPICFQGSPTNIHEDILQSLFSAVWSSQK